MQAAEHERGRLEYLLEKRVGVEVEPCEVGVRASHEPVTSEVRLKVLEI